MPVSVEANVQPKQALASLTTWQIGGEADALIRATHIEEVAEAVAWAKQIGMPTTIIGAGSNLLISDQGWPGLVILLRDQFSSYYFHDEFVTAQAGLRYPKLALACANHNLAGLEFAVSIPGTVGGAVTMNAGAHGGETRQHLHSVTLLRPDGEIEERSASDIPMSYRTTPFQDNGEIVLAATFRLTPSDRAPIDEKMKHFQDVRRKTQPVNQPSCGSVFRNPAGGHSGWYIEQAGLKGHLIGGAQISPLHANFIVNRGGATAEDVLQLVRLVRYTVRDRFDVELKPEFCRLGTFKTPIT